MSTRSAMRTIVNRIATLRGWRPPWPEETSNVDVDSLGDISAWGAADLGDAYAALLTTEARAHGGVYYTPEPVADAMAYAALAPRLGDRRHVRVYDPACGAGVLLESAARVLAGRDHGIRPEVICAAIYGTDIDPVAVELARAALWLVSDGTRPIEGYAGNVTCADPLAGDSPPRLGTSPRHLVILGNPPYREKAKGSAPWIEARRTPGEDPKARPSMDELRSTETAPHAHKLHSLSTYFWRWALWRAFEVRSGTGVIAFLTPSSFMGGPAYGELRRVMRGHADEGYVIDLTPEGLRPPVPTRLFPGVQQPLAVTVLARTGEEGTRVPAAVLHLRVEGAREEKAAAFRAACASIARGAAGTGSARAA